MVSPPTPFASCPSASRRTGNGLLLTAIIAVGLGASCRAHDKSPETTLARDSAGIEVIEFPIAPPAAAAAWRTADTPLVSIGGEDGPGQQLHQVIGAYRLANGAIVAANAGTFELLYYSPAGEWVRTSGRNGGGPGEFQSMDDVWLSGDDSVLVFDRSVRRLSVFGPDGAYVRSLQIADSGRPPQVLGRFADGTYLIRVADSFSPQGTEQRGLRREPYRLYRYSPAGEPLAHLGDFPGMEVFVSDAQGRFSVSVPPFGRNTFFAVGGDEFWAGDNAFYTLQAFDASGAPKRMLRRTGPQAALQRAEIEAEKARRLEASPSAESRRRTEARFREMSLPESPPAFRGILVDRAKRLWVAEWLRPEAGGLEWTVFGPSGSRMARTILPRGFSPLDVGDDFVLGVWRDDLGVEHLRLYQLVKS
jgi:hypothetical protein